jgi:hypothetical protein
MDHQLSSKRAQRLQAIAQDLGLIHKYDFTPRKPPSRPPTFALPDDERKADSILGQLKIEDAQAGKSPTRKRVAIPFPKTPKPTAATYEELYAGLLRAVEEDYGDGAGVVEVLLRRFQGPEVKGNVNLARRPSTGMMKRMRNAETVEERGRLLQVAVERRNGKVVKLLATGADERSLDEGLYIALQKREVGILETLLSYGEWILYVGGAVLTG